MHKRTVSKVLKELLARDGITPTELHRRTEVPQSTISRILSEKIADPADKHISKIAEYFRVTTDQLRGRQSLAYKTFSTLNTDKLIESNASLDGPFDVWDDDTPLDDDEVYVPFLKEVELSAGSGRTVVEQSSSRKLRFGKLTLKRQGVQASEAVCVTVCGNSMEPVLPNGSTVGVDQGTTSIIDGKMYALNHGGQLRVKMLYRMPKGGIRLRSYNRDEHPDEEYTEQEMLENELVILGKVFWYSVLV
ncbi:LexA family transcriptional regulator [Pseudomonas abietaniphila]|uniref:LexA family transcriptional regulator n=1 Tax=Pseudomonas abietaniphila TaxID=89065 RepID=UPI00078611F6|nr:helix-turn-helix transcriptional regulator [Pseudomonas abietaniphila]